MVIRGSTPTHKFSFPLDFSSIEKITITYKQFERVIKKTLPEVVYQEGYLMCKLTQEETMKLVAGNGYPVEIQIKCRDKSGNVKVSDIISVPVGKLLDEEIM